MTRGWGAGEWDLAQGLSPADSSLRVGSVSPLCPAWPLSMGSMSGPLRPRGKALWCALSDGAAQKWGAKGRKGPQGFHGGSSGGDLGVITRWWEWNVQEPHFHLEPQEGVWWWQLEQS